MTKAATARKGLAIEGGLPVRTEPFAPWPHFTPDEIAVVTAVLESGRVNYWTGDQGTRFEQEYATSLGRKHAVAVANGTVALELALEALGIGAGDEVIVPCRTFIATASCVAMRGARPVVVDVDRDSGNVTAATIAPAITPRTRAIIPVHHAGWPCRMDEILALASHHGLHVIEDCAQAHGAAFRKRPAGSFGVLAAFSFCQDKILTTGGEGGMLLTDDGHLWNRAWSYKDHGKSHRHAFRNGSRPTFGWPHESFGTNWRLTEMQSALGRVLLPKLPERVHIRRRNAAVLAQRLAGIPALRVPVPPAEEEHAYYKFYCYVRPERLREGWTQDRILAAVSAEGIPCQAGTCGEIYLEKAFGPELRPRERFSVARELGETSLMFLVHSTLSEADMHDTAVAVEKVMVVASA